jgi:hypothetical protein
MRDALHISLPDRLGDVSEGERPVGDPGDRELYHHAFAGKAMADSAGSISVTGQR